MQLDSEFAAKAAHHWTKDREAKVTGGKDWLIKPSESAEVLRAIGLLNADASMAADSVRKFSQINHMLTLLRPVLEDLLARHKQLRVVDACCGTSYLSLLLAWLLRRKWHKDAQIIGIDANAKVIETSQKRAQALGLDDVLRFTTARVGDKPWESIYSELFSVSTDGDGSLKVPRPHLVISLHACDTATDHAMAFAVHAKADAMAFAPCCHAELARKWKEVAEAKTQHPFSPIFQSPNIRRETAAHFTDAMRMLLLRSRGYEVTATEFVPAAHTVKNRLLLCQRRGQFLKSAGAEFQAMKTALLNTGIALEDLIADKLETH